MIPVISILFAIGLPLFALRKQVKEQPLRRPWLFSAGSFLFCTVGILAEIFTIKQRLFAGDIGGIEDTIQAVLTICIVLFVITAALNLPLLAVSYEKKE